MELTQETSKSVDALFETYLAGVDGSGRVGGAVTAEESRRAHDSLIALGPDAAAVLAVRFADPTFAVKDAVYDLLIEMGPAVVPTLRDDDHSLDPTPLIWVAAIRHHFGDDNAATVLLTILGSGPAYARHLSALALSFQGLIPAGEKERVVGVLVEALRDDERLEGSAFSVAGAALACIQTMTGERFLPPEKPITFYNYDRFAFPPPVHPFPFVSDYLVGSSPTEREAIVGRVEAWWSSPHRNLHITPIEPMWPTARAREP